MEDVVRLKDIDIPFVVSTKVPLSGILKSVKSYLQTEISKKIKKNEYLGRALTIKFTDEDIELEDIEFTTKSHFVKKVYERPLRAPTTSFQYGEFNSDTKKEIIDNIFRR